MMKRMISVLVLVFIVLFVFVSGIVIVFIQGNSEFKMLIDVECLFDLVG